VAQRLGPTRGVAIRAKPGSPSRVTIRGTPRLGSGTRAAIGQRRRRPVESEGAPCYAFRARRFRAEAGPARNQGGGRAKGESNAVPAEQRPASHSESDPHVLIPCWLARGFTAPRPGVAAAAYRAEQDLLNDSHSRAVLPRVASVPVPFVTIEVLAILAWVRT
jgi:hypothetical protein